MRINTTSIALFALTAMGCNSTEFAYVPLQVPVPGVEEDEMTMTRSCTFDPNGAPASVINIDFSGDANGDQVLDSTINLAVTVENVLDPLEIQIDMAQTDNIKVPRNITPLRFDFRWECDSTGFQGDLGPIILPAFSLDADRPFCLDTREKVTGEFVGFDVVQATGSPVGPGDRGIVRFSPIPPQLGLAFREFFDVAINAENCCDAIEAVGADCGGENLMGAATTYPECGQFQDILDSFGGSLNVEVEADLQRFRPFIEYTNRATAGRGNAYPMRLSGFIEGVLPGGELITSTQLIRGMGICSGSGCGTGGGVGQCLVN